MSSAAPGTLSIKTSLTPSAEGRWRNQFREAADVHRPPPFLYDCDECHRESRSKPAAAQSAFVALTVIDSIVCLVGGAARPIG